jgi:hypothetical protein
MLFRVTDIETIPDLSVWTQNAPTYKLVPVHQTVRSGALDRIQPAGVEQADAFPPPQAHRVVSISYVDISFDPMQAPKYRFERCYTECRWASDEKGLDVEEKALLTSFGADMATTQLGDKQVSSPDIHLVTWNGRSFDLPVIVMRSLKHRISCGWYYSNRDMRYRFSAEGHCDLMDFMGDYGAVRSMKLADVCHLVGLPGKIDISGASVEGIYKSTKDGTPEEIAKAKAQVAKYCLQDSIQTALLFIITRHHFGKIIPSTFNEVLNTFRASPEVFDTLPLDWDRLYLSPGENL